MAYKEIVGTPIVKIDGTNTQIEGVLLAIEEGIYGNQFRIKLLDGKEVILGNAKVLETKIKPSHVGKMVKVVFDGEKKSTKNPRNVYVDYKVYVNE